MKRILLAAASAATMLVAGAAQAATVTYANFGQLPGHTPALAYTDASVGNGGTLTNNGAQEVMFWFLGSGLPPVLTGPQIANFTMNATSTSTASLAGPFVFQNFESGSLSFIRTTSAGVGANTGTNLLTINFTNFLLSGQTGSDVPTGSATTLSSTNASTMTITSDFYDFTGLTSSNFSFSMSAAAPALGVTGNDLNSFVADSTGTFASNPGPTYVPEPAMLGLFGMGAVTLGLARRRKK